VSAPLNREEFEARLREQGKRYHIHHPFNIRMSRGQLNPRQIRAWVLNRFYYQVCIPLKDAAMLSNCPDRGVRREWIQRILDHDGYGEEPGGIEAWIQLGEAVGIERAELTSLQSVVPGARFAVDAYVNFARTRPWQETVCASLTEMFAPQIHEQRLANWPQHYPWIDPKGLAYFRNRLSEARRDVDWALAFTLDYFTTRERQERAVEILNFKLDVLWSMLDAIATAYPDEAGAAEAARG
jgi:pyrroloquinoline-quinone synthase